LAAFAVTQPRTLPKRRLVQEADALRR
jgi:hypothetical protein